jgi:hypothetical protein
MTQVICDLRTIFDQPFTGRITFDPAQSGFGDCRLYLDIAQTYDLDNTVASIDLVPSSRVGSYEVSVTSDDSDTVVFSGTIVVPDSGTPCLSDLVGLESPEVQPGFSLVTSVNGQSGDVVLSTSGSPVWGSITGTLNNQTDLATRLSSASAETDELEAEIAAVPNLVLIFENALI